MYTSRTSRHSRRSGTRPVRAAPRSTESQCDAVCAGLSEIESGRNAIASTTPREMIESAIASRPSFAPPSLRKVPIFTR